MRKTLVRRDLDSVRVQELWLTPSKAPSRGPPGTGSSAPDVLAFRCFSQYGASFTLPFHSKLEAKQKVQDVRFSFALFAEQIFLSWIFTMPQSKCSVTH